LSAHIISPAKYGKTTLVLTLPKPLLIVDCDGGLESLFNERVIGERLQKEVADGLVDVAKPRDFKELQEAVVVRWKDKPYASLAIDTMSWALTHIIKQEILAMSGREKMELQDWGLYLERGLSIAKKAHDLALRADGCHTVLTFHEADKGGEDGQIGKLGPSVQGQLFEILPGIPNYVLFMRILRTGVDQKTRQAVLERKLQTVADNRTPAGSRRPLEPYEEPDLAAIWEKVKPYGK
jgi:hypothetical protein